MIPPWVFWVLGVSGAVVAAFLAWREEYRGTQKAADGARAEKERLEAIIANLMAEGPKLTGDILSLAWHKISETQCGLFLCIKILNEGSSPSIVKEYSVSIRMGSTVTAGSLMLITKGTTIMNQDGQGVNPTPLYDETTRPIPAGGLAGGWLSIQFNASIESVYREGNLVLLGFQDVKGIHYSTEAPVLGDGSKGGTKFYPGTGSKPFKLPFD